MARSAIPSSWVHCFFVFLLVTIFWPCAESSAVHVSLNDADVGVRFLSATEYLSRTAGFWWNDLTEKTCDWYLTLAGKLGSWFRLFPDSCSDRSLHYRRWAWLVCRWNQPLCGSRGAKEDEHYAFNANSGPMVFGASLS